MVSHTKEHKVSASALRRSIIYPLVGIASAASLIIGMVPASAIANGEQSGVLPGIAPSSSLENAPVASGILIDEQGDPVSAGEQVVLYAWPSTVILDKMEEDESVKLVPVAKTKTQGSGQFELRIDETETLKALASADGEVDFTIFSANGSSQYSHSFSANVGKSTPKIRSRMVGKVGEEGSSTPTSNAPHQRLQSLQLKPFISEAENPSVFKESREPKDGIAYSNKTCQSYKVKEYQPSWVTLIGGLIYNTDGVTADYTYSTGAGTKLGIGVSASGGFGSFSVGGSTSVSSERTIGFPTQNSMTELRTQFQYAKFFVQCRHTGVLVSEEYQVRPIAFVGGSRVVDYRYYPAMGMCTEFAAGSSFTHSDSVATMFTYGAILEAAIGANLSSQTNYTANSKIRFDFTKTRRLCGQGDWPGGQPSSLQARPLL